MKRLFLAIMLLWAGLVRATVTSTTVQNSYVCNGSTTAFAVTFPFVASSDLTVTRTTTTAATTTLALGTDYTVSGATLTTTGPSSPCTSGYTLTITRNTPLTQPLHLTNQGPYSPKALENAYDRLTMGLQQLSWSQQVNGVLSPTAQTTIQNYIQGVLGSGTSVIPQSWTATGDGAATGFLLNGATVTAPNLYSVTIDGVVQKPVTDYSVNGTTSQITFTAAPPSGSSIEVVCFGYASTSSIADTTTISTKGPYATLATELSGWVNVRSYGAKGDGVTDDTAAFKSAIAGAIAAGHYTVIVPGGTYKITDTLNMASSLIGTTDYGVKMIGSGRLRTLLNVTMPTSRDLFVWAGAGDANHFMQGGGLVGIGVVGLSANLRDALSFTHTINSIVEDVWVVDAYRNGLYIADTIQFVEDRFFTQGGSFAGDSQYGIFISGGTTVTLRRPYHQSCYTAGIHIEGFAVGITIQDPIIENTGQGTNLASIALEIKGKSRVTVINPYFEQNGASDLWVGGNDTSVDYPNVTLVGPTITGSSKLGGGHYCFNVESAQGFAMWGGDLIDVTQSIVVQTSKTENLNIVGASLGSDPVEWNTFAALNPANVKGVVIWNHAATQTMQMVANTISAASFSSTGYSVGGTGDLIAKSLTSTGGTVTRGGTGSVDLLGTASNAAGSKAATISNLTALTTAGAKALAIYSDNAGTEAASIRTNGTRYGLRLQSPDGTWYLVTVANGGTLSVSANP
jgi:hypothetical protein